MTRRRLLVAVDRVVASTVELRPAREAGGTQAQTRWAASQTRLGMEWVGTSTEEGKHLRDNRWEAGEEEELHHRKAGELRP